VYQHSSYCFYCPVLANTRLYVQIFNHFVQPKPLTEYMSRLLHCDFVVHNLQRFPCVDVGAVTTGARSQCCHCLCSSIRPAEFLRFKRDIVNLKGVPPTGIDEVLTNELRNTLFRSIMPRGAGLFTLGGANGLPEYDLLVSGVGSAIEHVTRR
jgi:hypothetical protein